MISYMKKLRSVSLSTLIAFICNVFGLPAYTLAANLSLSSPATDSIVQQGTRVKETLVVIEAVKSDLSAGLSPAAHLEDLQRKADEIAKIDSTIRSQFVKREAELNDLLQKGGCKKFCVNEFSFTVPASAPRTIS